MHMTRYWMTGCMALILLLAGRAPAREDGDEGGSRRQWVTMTSRHDVSGTARLLERAARTHGLPVVARAEAPVASDLDHEVAQAQVLVLGVQGGQTPAVQMQGDTAPDLPLRLWLRQRADGQTDVSFADPAELARWHGAPPGEWLDQMGVLPQIVQAAIA